MLDSVSPSAPAARNQTRLDEGLGDRGRGRLGKEDRGAPRGKPEVS